MYKLVATSILLIGILLNGCSPITSGNKMLGEMNTDEVNDQIIKGKSTKNDVKTFMGEPNTVDMDENGNEKWIYIFIQKDTTATGLIPIANQFILPLDGYKKTLIFLFDKNGVVKNYIAHEGKCEDGCSVFE